MRFESNRRHGPHGSDRGGRHDGTRDGQHDDHRRFARAMRGGGWEHDHGPGHGPDHGHGHGHDREREGRTRDGRGYGRRGRVFDHGDLRLVVLQLIAEKPRHGYEIIKAIEEKVGGAYSPSPGVVYPTLTMLEELGHVTVAEQDGKKLHALTDAGREYLDANRPAIDALQG